jgi:hypothetical protein
MRQLMMCLCLVLIASAAQAGTAPKIKELEKLLGDANAVASRNPDPVKMIYKWLYSEHNKESVDGLKFKRNAPAMEVDAHVAGTVSSSVVCKELAQGVMHGAFMIGDKDPTTAQRRKMGRKGCDLIKELAKMGVTFGFDGMQQNEGPTTYLLIADPSTKAVYGFDLSPSEPFSIDSSFLR